LGTTILHTRGPRSQRYMLNMWQFLDLSRMSNILFRFSSSEISIVTFFHHTPPYPSCLGYYFLFIPHSSIHLSDINRYIFSPHSSLPLLSWLLISIYPTLQHPFIRYRSLHFFLMQL
jgi:hypothetical protein